MYKTNTATQPGATTFDLPLKKIRIVGQGQNKINIKCHINRFKKSFTGPHVYIFINCCQLIQLLFIICNFLVLIFIQTTHCIQFFKSQSVITNLKIIFQYKMYIHCSYCTSNLLLYRQCIFIVTFLTVDILYTKDYNVYFLFTMSTFYLQCVLFITVYNLNNYFIFKQL